SSVAQWQSNRLLTDRLLVRVQPGEPIRTPAFPPEPRGFSLSRTVRRNDCSALAPTRARQRVLHRRRTDRPPGRTAGDENLDSDPHGVRTSSRAFPRARRHPRTRRLAAELGMVRGTGSIRRRLARAPPWSCARFSGSGNELTKAQRGSASCGYRRGPETSPSV